MADAKENKGFTEAMIGRWPLDEAIEWISKNLDPDDVFDEEKLEEWANKTGGA